MLLENKVIHLCCGLGAAAYGMQKSKGEYKGSVGKFRTLVGIDVDPLAVQDFRRLTGAPAVQMDLFSRRDYIDFHGHVPPEGWREVVPEDIFEAAGREYPNTGFISAPCQGLSALLSIQAALSKKYQALNNLSIRCVQLALEAFEFDPIDIFLFENVPGIRTRGKKLLEEIRRLFKYHGYLTADKKDEIYNCGELGGLGQNRNRYLFMTRHPKKVPAFVYKPPKLPLKTIGDVIGSLPSPNDPAGGPMHQLPKLQWKTWVRLALIKAGGDWRDLRDIKPEQYRIMHVPRNSSFGVMDWNKPSSTITGNVRTGGSTSAAISDPCMSLSRENTHKAIYKVSRYEEPANTVTGAHGPNNGAIVIPDPMLKSCKGKHPSVYKICRIDETSPCVTGTKFGSGALAISDPSLGCKPRNGTLGVQAWNEPAKTVIASNDIHAGTSAVADPHIPADAESGVYVIIAEDGSWHRPLTTLELAALQTIPLFMPDGSPLVLAGKSDARWRKAIGNAVPPDAAEAMGNQVLVAWMAGKLGWEWQLSNQEIWVKPKIKDEWIDESIGGALQ
ncbi:MAG: cytosine methyltransferase [Anaerosporomusa subterranea]|jgi:site-specific DNA-cytosine methylase|nr:cytosine methyltransferase [Anaerosporomusa subterranea]